MHTFFYLALFLWFCILLIFLCCNIAPQVSSISWTKSVSELLFHEGQKLGHRTVRFWNLFNTIALNYFPSYLSPHPTILKGKKAKLCGHARIQTRFLCSLFLSNNLSLCFLARPVQQQKTKQRKHLHSGQACYCTVSEWSSLASLTSCNCFSDTCLTTDLHTLVRI